MKHLKKQGRFIAREVTMPNKGNDCFGAKGIERVDILAMERPNSWDRAKSAFVLGKTTWRFYEIKVTYADFKSKCKLTFKGHYNYYVVPKELYDEIPKSKFKKGIGIFVVYDNGNVQCIKRPAKKKLSINEEILKHRFIVALTRDASKFYSKR